MTCKPDENGMKLRIHSNGVGLNAGDAFSMILPMYS